MQTRSCSVENDSVMRVLACSERVFEKVMGPPQRGLVHSAFASAANVIFSNGFLLSLNASPTPHIYDYPKKGLLGQNAGGASILAQQTFFRVDEVALPLMPNGLLLSVHAGEWPFAALKVGMPVVLGAGWLALEAISCSLDCTSCPRWNPHIERPTWLDIELIRENARQLTTLCQLHRPLKSDVLSTCAGGETLQMLAEKLCGRGPGLTPSGDDFLAGWLAVGWLLYGPEPAFLASCQRVIEIASRRTHALSQCWLAYAAAGDVAHPINELLTALTQGAPRLLEHAAKSVLTLGATSGYDLLQGMLYGIEQFPLL